MCENNDIVDDYCSKHGLIACHVIGHEFMLKFMEIIMLNVMFGLSCGCLWILWEMGYNHAKWCFDELSYMIVLLKLLIWWNG